MYKNAKIVWISASKASRHSYKVYIYEYVDLLKYIYRTHLSHYTIVFNVFACVRLWVYVFNRTEYICFPNHFESIAAYFFETLSYFYQWENDR